MATAAETALIEPIESQSSRSATSLFAVVWQRKPLVILGIVIALVLGSLFYAQRQPVYQSVAQILVVKRSADVLVGTADRPRATFQEDYMSSQSVILKSQQIAERTVASEKIKKRFEEKNGFLSFPECSKPEELVPEIIKNLTVTRENREANQNSQGNNVLLLAFRATDRGEAMLILDNLIDAYQKFIDEQYQSISETVFKELTRLRDELSKDIQVAQKKLSDFQNQTPLENQKIAGGTSAVAKRLQLYAERLAVLDYELKTRQNDLATLRDLYQTRGPGLTIQYLLANGKRVMATGDPETDKQLIQLKMIESDFLSKYGAKHPQVLSVRSQINHLKTELFNREKVKALDKDMDLAQLYIENLDIEVKAMLSTKQLLEGEHTKLLDQIKVLSKSDHDEQVLRAERDRAQVMFMNASQALTDSTMKKESGGFRVVTLTRPGIGTKVAPIAYQVFAAAGLLGVLLGVALAYLAEISDKSFRNPSEIRRRLGLPVIGHVPFLAADEKASQLVAAGSSTIDPMLITHYQSGSVGAEAYRGVRTALYFSTQGAGHQVIQVTSPNVSDGKSTLAANLAVSIAQSGKRTLLVDCDFRKPRVHKIFNVPATVGMASVMVGQADLNSAAQPTVVPNLSVMPCGPRPGNPAELLTSPRFKELLEELRMKYDFVLVDTPPVLVVTDPAVVAPRVDGVVLCIRVAKNGRPFAERAREVLGSVGANVLGVVVNGFGTQVGGNRYGYEHYNYGEGYSYTYGYTYGYADKEAASYYAGANEEKPQSGVPASKS